MAEDSNQHEVETMIPRFECSETGLRDGKAYLEEHGYAVFKEVISKDDIEDAKNLFWDFIGTETFTSRFQGQKQRNIRHMLCYDHTKSRNHISL